MYLILALLLLVTTSVNAGESITYIHTDHLGSPIAATNEDGSVKWTEDYQPFGVQRTNQDTDNTTGFTGHQHDDALELTYMQARWYHPEVGRFMALDPIVFRTSNLQSFGRYTYGNNNPYRYIDPDGKAPNRAGLTDPSTIINEVKKYEANGLSYEDSLSALSKNHGSNTDRYFYTDEYGWVDVRHFGKAAEFASSSGSVMTEFLGFGNEISQWVTEWGDDYRSGFSPEDISSNAAGAEFGDDYLNSGSVSKDLQKWMKDSGARKKNHPKAGAYKLPKTDPAVRGGNNRGSSNASNSAGPGAKNCPNSASSCS